MSLAPHAMRFMVEDALPGSHAEIIKQTGLGRTTVWRWLKQMHQERCIHIARWHRTPGGGPFIPTYAKGPGKDAPCRLKPLTEAQKSARFRAAARKDGRWDDRNARVRARAAADRADFRRDPLLSALFAR
jgi:DNA invertase Pin-like site-specific DNA recombinase